MTDYKVHYEYEISDQGKAFVSHVFTAKSPEAACVKAANYFYDTAQILPQLGSTYVFNVTNQKTGNSIRMRINTYAQLAFCANPCTYQEKD